eukprot:615908-Rhodomonas_salina.1
MSSHTRSWYQTKPYVSTGHRIACATGHRLSGHRKYPCSELYLGLIAPPEIVHARLVQQPSLRTGDRRGRV